MSLNRIKSIIGIIAFAIVWEKIKIAMSTFEKDKTHSIYFFIVS